ncbi:hypothetical protein PE36_10033 [Moritella sp. PE36]|nr:hypothetical protein PE36_10033 [Moritella sp. PE36]
MVSLISTIGLLLFFDLNGNIKLQPFVNRYIVIGTFALASF